MEKLHHHKFRCLKAIDDTSKNMASSDQYAVNSDRLSTLLCFTFSHALCGWLKVLCVNYSLFEDV